MKYFALFLFLIACTACVRKSAQIPANKPTNAVSTEQSLMAYNKACLAAEKEEITAFLDSNHTYIECEEGWWIQVVEKGKGPTIKNQQTVTINYSVERLDGTVCYSSATEGSKTLVVGKRQWLQGIDLVLPTLTIGTEANILLPSRMAYGQRGKDQCIGSYCPLLCRIQIKP